MLKNAGEAVAARAPAPTRPVQGRIVARLIRRRRATLTFERRGQRGRPARQGPRPPDRALCHHPREGHRPRSGHRQAHPGGARRRAGADRRAPTCPARARHPALPARKRAPINQSQSCFRSRRLKVHGSRHPGGRRRGRHPRPGGGHPRRRGAIRCAAAADSDAALAAIRARRPSLLIQDIWMQGGGLDGLELLDVVKETGPRPAGGDDLRPRQHRDRRHRPSSAAPTTSWKSRSSPTACCCWSSAPWRRATAPREQRRLRAQAITPGRPDRQVGGRPGPARPDRQDRPANSRILIAGPPGSGKELIARLIHEASARCRRRVRRPSAPPA